MIDLRSDTVTHPSQAMRLAMVQAPVGDDVYGDDPLTNELEAYLADLLGKEAAIFVPSGTFANQLALLCHTQRGQEVIVGQEAHVLAHEVGAASVIAGVQLRPVASPRGVMDLDEVARTIRQDDLHYPETGLICTENAHGGGCVVPLEDMKALYDLAKAHGLPVHLDGARLFNAAQALGQEAKTLCLYADTINVCLSKGLCAPVGSMLVGPKAFIEKARKLRKLMGGGMRQTGILAAAGLIALKEMTKRLDQDHARAKRLAAALDAMPGIEVAKDRLDINMVFFTLDDQVVTESSLLLGLKKEGILSNGREEGEYRFVTHKDIDDKDLDHVIGVMAKLVNFREE